MDKQIETIMKGVIAKMDAMEKCVFEVLAVLQDIHQRQKHLQYTIAQGKDSDAHVPKGESDTVLCESCSRRIKRTEVMKKTRNVEDKLVIFSVCKKCFYRQD